MEQVIVKLRSVIAEGTELIAEYRKKLEYVVNEKLRLDKVGADLDKLKHDLLAREAEVQKVENIQKLHKDATALQDAVQLRLNAVVEAEKALGIRKSTVDQELNNKRELLNRESLALEKAKKSLEDLVNARVQAIVSKHNL